MFQKFFALEKQLIKTSKSGQLHDQIMDGFNCFGRPRN